MFFLYINLAASDPAYQVCKEKNIYIDVFPAYLDSDCSSLPTNKITDVLELVGSNRTGTLTVSGRNIFRLRTCDSNSNECSNKISDSTDIICHTDEQEYRNLSCTESIVNQWINITTYDKLSSELSINMSLLDKSTKHLCNLRNSEGLKLEIFALSPKIDVSISGDVSPQNCEKYSQGDERIRFFGDASKFTNETFSKKIGFVSGQFLFRFSRFSDIACTDVMRYENTVQEDVASIWESETCRGGKIKPEINVAPNNGTNGNCYLRVKSVSLWDCYLKNNTFNSDVITTAIQHGRCPHVDDDNTSRHVNRIGNITSVQIKNRTLDDAFNLTVPSTGTVCITITLQGSYPFCTSTRLRKEKFCSFIVPPLPLNNCHW
jgi:hypothetical protein